MVFGWFSREQEVGDKRLIKARKLRSQRRWAEALSYYEEAVEQNSASEESMLGARFCREQLVAINLEEARSYRTSDPHKAREHAELALRLAGSEADLRAQAEGVLEGVGPLQEAPRPGLAEPGSRPFEPSCACPTPCPEEDLEADVEEEDLFALYLEAAEPKEGEAFASLGPAFREGYVLLHQGDLAGARESLVRAAAEAPDAPGAHYALGLLEGVEGHPEQAEAFFRKALEVDPEFAPAARHRADVLRELGRRAEAVSTLEVWLRSHPEDGEARFVLATCLLDGQDFAGTLREAGEARRWVSADDLRPSLLTAQALRLSGKRSEALQTLQGVLARKPDLLDALIPTGDLLMEEGGSSAERAAEVFKRCYQIDSDRGWWYLVKVSQAYAARGWKAEAREMLDRARSELPAAPEALDAWQAVSNQLG